MPDSNQPLDWSLWDSNMPQNAAGEPAAPASTVDGFKKKQKDDGTKVGGIESAVLPKLESAIKSGKSNAATGWLVNPAMRVMETLGKRVVQPLTQGVSTGFLTVEALQQGKGAESFRFAKEQAKKISMGQALATGIGQALGGGVIPSSVTPTFMDPGFNVFDDAQRTKAFRDEWWGIAASGSTDLALAAIGTKGAGTLVKSGVKAALGPKKIYTPQDMNVFKNKAQETVDWAKAADGTPPPSGLGVLINNAVKETDVTKLSANPLVYETSNPYRTATILSRLDNHEDVANYLLAERGDAQAFNNFFKSKPLAADHLDNYGINNFEPIADWSTIHLDTISPKLTDRYQALIDAKAKTDPNFAAALDDFKSKATSGVIESYQPGRFGFAENIALQKKKLSLAAKYGDIKLFGKDAVDSGWKTSVYQSETYDRAIRTIAWVGSGRPQGHINISNPRQFEASNDLLSDLNRLQMLRGADGAQFKRDMVKKFLDAQDDTQRAIALADIEKQVMFKLADSYGVKSVGGIATDKDAVDQITRWHVGTSQRRQTVKQYAVNHGFIPDDNGNLNVTNFWSPTNEAQTVPMLDFRKLEIEVMLQTKRLAGAAAPISKGQIAGAYASRALMSTGQVLDLANMVFNSLNLLRVAYIPKNSMVDPLARGSMAMESTELITNLFPGASNATYNTSLRAQSLSRWVPGTAGSTSRKMEKAISKEMELLKGDLDKAVPAWETAQKDYDIANSLYVNAKNKQAKAAAKANKLKTPEAETAMFNADEAAWEAEKELSNAKDVLDRTGSSVQGLSTVMEKHRAKLTQSVIATGNKNRYRHLGQDAEIIEVNGKKYNIAGLADPNVRGANAYMSEVDSAQNFINTAMQSEISRNLSSRGARFVTIASNEGKPYWNALTHVANRQVRNELDMPIGMMMRGDDPASILKWLYTGDAGKEYRRRMASRAGRDLTQEDFATWISTTSDKLNKMYPSQELRDLILQRPVSIKEVESLLKGRTDLSPTVDGPNIDLTDLSNAERKFAKVLGVQDAAWRLLAASETRMVRNPMFLSYTREEMKTLIAAAHRAGIDPSESVVNNQIRQVAYRNALSRVEKTLYSSRRLTNGMYAARYAMSFPLAFFNSQAVGLRLMAKNPMNAYWYNSIANAFDNFHAYEDKNGNTYKSASDVPRGTQVTVSYPLPFGNKLPQWAKDALQPYADKRGGGIKWNPKQMAFMIADPSVSWFGTVAISDLVSHGFNTPLWKAHGEDISTALRSSVGNDVYENSILYGGYPTEGSNLMKIAANTVLPGYMQSTLDAIGLTKSDRHLDEIYTHYRTLYSEWDRNGRVGEPPTMEKAAAAAGNMAFIRAIAQFNLPIATSFDPVTRSATSYYAKLLKENGGDYNAAQKQMESEWGVDSIALIGSNQKNVAGIAPNIADIKMIRNNKTLLEKIARTDPNYAQMLSVGYGDITDQGQYSVEVSSIYKGLDFPGTMTKLTTKKTDLELKQDIESKRGWYEYNKAVQWRDSTMYQWGVKSTSDSRYETLGVKQQFDGMVQQTAQDFPGWAVLRQKSRNDFWLSTFPIIKTIANDPAWRKKADAAGPKWQEISYWVNVANDFKNQYDSPMSSAARKSSLVDDFSQFHYNFMQGASDDFGAFASRWLESMPQLDIGQVIG